MISFSVAVGRAFSEAVQYVLVVGEVMSDGKQVLWQAVAERVGVGRWCSAKHMKA